MSNVARLWIHSMAVGVFLPPCTSPIVYARCMLGEALVQDWCFVGLLAGQATEAAGD